MYEWTIDYITLGVYLIGVTVIGTLTARRVSSASKFFMGERKFGKWMMTMFTSVQGRVPIRLSPPSRRPTRWVHRASGTSGLWIFATPSTGCWRRSSGA